MAARKVLHVLHRHSWGHAVGLQRNGTIRHGTVRYGHRAHWGHGVCRVVARALRNGRLHRHVVRRGNAAVGYFRLENGSEGVWAPLAFTPAVATHGTRLLDRCMITAHGGLRNHSFVGL